MNLKILIGRILTYPALGRLLITISGGRIPQRDVRIDVRNERIPATNVAGIWWGLYECHEVSYVRQYLRPDLDVIELGSSIGVVAVQIARRQQPSRQLICLEANPFLIPTIRANLELNAPAKPAKVLNKALDYSGQTTILFEITDNNLGAHVISHQQPNSVEVPADIAPEYVRIPAVGQNNIHLSRLSLLFEDDSGILKSKHYQLDELVNSINVQGQNWMDIPLNADQLLGANPTGYYTLRIYQPPYLDWQSSFCVVPHLTISFDRMVYSPHLEAARDIQATLSLPEASTFKPDSPAELGNNEGSSWLLTTPVTENRISGILSCSIAGAGKITMPLAIMVPKIRWRLQSSDETVNDTWLDVVKDELWLGDQIILASVLTTAE